MTNAVLAAVALVVAPELQHGFPTGTPVEGSELVTVDAVHEPCKLKLDPPCPGHTKTNRVRWVYHGGQWRKGVEYEFHRPVNGGRTYDYTPR